MTQEEERMYAQLWRLVFPEKVIKSNRDWYRNNRQKALHNSATWYAGMSWSNYGKGSDKWNIDHIIPCSLFDFSKADHQRVCFHFLNLQPMWESENIAKGNKTRNAHLNT